MPNYYYDAPPDFTPDDELEIFVPMEQPKENITCPYYLFRVNKSTATFQNNYWAGRDRNQIRHKRTRVPLPYPLGAQVGVREACIYCGGDGKETCDNPDHGFLNAMSFHDIGRIGCPCCGHDPKHKVPNGGDCPECEGKGWVVTVHYTVTEVDVVQRDGQWVEKVTMRSEK